MCMISVTSAAVAPLLEDNAYIRRDVTGRLPNPRTWGDSYSVGDSCYCASSYDHSIGTITVNTPLGVMTTREVCELLGQGPGIEDRPIYNDIQCGNGPPNDVRHELDCPGRIEHGKNGCRYIGPKWNFSRFLNATNVTAPVFPAKVPTRAPVTATAKAPVVAPVKAPTIPSAVTTNAPVQATFTSSPATQEINQTCGQILQFDLWDGASDQGVFPYMRNGMTICQPLQVTVDAVPDRCVRRVRFDMTGPNNYRFTRNELAAPFFLFGNIASGVFGRTLAVDGVYTIVATPNGQSALNKTITFNMSQCYSVNTGIEE
jgi:hypothetical protein